MRFALGLVVGVLLTFGTAYVVDSVHSTSGPDGKEAPRMVNWDVVSANAHGLSDGVQSAWYRIVGGVKKFSNRSGA